MNINEKIESLKHTIDRYDHYYDSINNKGNLYMAINTFLIAGIITGYCSIKDDYQINFLDNLFVGLAILSTLISVLYTLKAIIPYMNSCDKKNNTSLLNYTAISSLEINDFKSSFSELSEQFLYEDYTIQTYQLAKGLQLKFTFLKCATYALGSSFIFILLSLLTLNYL